MLALYQKTNEREHGLKQRAILWRLELDFQMF
jgi:hypothetical protein